MTIQNHSTTLSPATPTVADMVSATIRCVFYHPWERPAIEKIGVVTKLTTHKNILYMWVEATDGKAKWVSEFDFVEYVRETEPPACPCCGEPLHQFESPGLIAGRSAHKLAECHTSECPLYMVTLGIEHFAKLTEADVASYQRAKAAY